MMEKNTWCVVSACLLGIVFLSSCSKEEEFPERDNSDEVKTFYGHYNGLIKAEIDRDVAKLQSQLEDAGLDDESRIAKQTALATLRERQKNPEVFTFASIDDLPADLNWETNWDEPEIGSDKAKKGGVFHYYFEG